MKEKIKEFISSLVESLKVIVLVALGIIVLFGMAKDCGKPVAEMPGYCLALYGK